MNDLQSKPAVGILGATSFVGSLLLPRLLQQDCGITAYSRSPRADSCEGIRWQQLGCPGDADSIGLWISVAPLWVLPQYFSFLDRHGVRRIVALSSTSRFTKKASSSLEEQAYVHRLVEAEARLREWAESRGVEWIILRPTLIYGLGRDKNITEIARFIRRFGFFPVFGKAQGLRQPVHVQDVAQACVSALTSANVTNRAYNLAGGETLPYREMVTRIFTALDKSPRMLPVPLVAFELAVTVLRCLPRYRFWTAAMAERMNLDMAFDHSDAARDLGYSPRSFRPGAQDVAV